VDCGALQRALNAIRIVRLQLLGFGYSLKVLIEVLDQLLLEQFQVGAAMLKDIAGSDVMQHRVEQMFEADVLMAAVERFGHRELQSDLQFTAYHHA
jgi:hypothetical protein